jgi:predicted negative regulator of RcsB-dependent stress response
LEENLDIEEGQRAEALKAFWRRYRMPLIILAVGIVLAAVAAYGYTNWRQSQLLNASQQYSSAVQALEEGRNGDARAGFKALISKYGGTPYAAFGRVFRARLLHEGDQSQEALKVLGPLVGGEAGPSEARHIGVEEAARIRWDRQGAEAALSELEALSGSAYLPSYFLLKGDLLAELERPDEARSAYRQARDRAGGQVLQRTVDARLDRLPAPANGEQE